MQVDLHKLPFAFLSNADANVFTGTVHLACVLTDLSANALRPMMLAVNAWVRVVNDQFLTTMAHDARMEAEPYGQVVAHTMLIVKLSCTSVEPTAWLTLLGLLAQVQHTEGVLRMAQLQLENGRPVVDASGENWPSVAMESLFSDQRRPACFDEIGNLMLEETVDISLELATPVDRETIDRIQGSLQLWGYLVVMGALHFDFKVREVVDEDLGRASQLTATWLEYSKDNFDGPPESLYLLDHWANGMARRGVLFTSFDISQ